MSDAHTQAERRELLQSLHASAEDRVQQLDREIQTLLENPDVSSSTEDGEGAASVTAVGQLQRLRSSALERRETAEEALRQLEAGTYGVCVSCGKDIPLERLQALPSARECVPCKSARGR